MVWTSWVVVDFQAATLKAFDSGNFSTSMWECSQAATLRHSALIWFWGVYWDIYCDCEDWRGWGCFFSIDLFYVGGWGFSREGRGRG